MKSLTIQESTTNKSNDFPKNPNNFSRNLIFLLCCFFICYFLINTSSRKKGTILFSEVVDQLPNGSYELTHQQFLALEEKISATKKQKPRTLLFEDVVEKNGDGNYRLAEERRRKYLETITRYSEAEQYVLKTAYNGYYPCLSCPFRDSIFLFANEVYRYGVTINGSGGRGYSRSYLKAKGLKYFIQYEGDLVLCKIQEVQKIFMYPLLAENLKRSKPIARPPGNPVDN